MKCTGWGLWSTLQHNKREAGWVSNPPDSIQDPGRDRAKCLWRKLEDGGIIVIRWTRRCECMNVTVCRCRPCREQINNPVSYRLKQQI